MVVPFILLSLLGTASAGTMQVHMLDVGQGDAILLQTPAGKNLLIDAGKKGAKEIGRAHV